MYIYRHIYVYTCTQTYIGVIYAFCQWEKELCGSESGLAGIEDSGGNLVLFIRFWDHFGMFICVYIYYMCVYTYIFIYICIYIYVYILHIHIYICTYSCIYSYTP
jgi:hypothetical protein